MIKEYSIKNWLRYLIREQEEKDDSEPDMQTDIVQKTFQQQPAIDQDQYRLEGIAKNLEARKEIDVFSGGPIKCFGPRPTPGVKYQKFNSLQAQPYYGAFQRTGQVSMNSVRGDSRDEEFFNPDGSENYRYPNVVTNEYGPGQYKPTGGSTKGYFVHHWTIWKPADAVSNIPPPPVIKTPPVVQQPPAPAVQEKKPIIIPPKGIYFYKVLREDTKNYPLLFITARKIKGRKEVSSDIAKAVLETYINTPKENLGLLLHNAYKETSKVGAYFLKEPKKYQITNTPINGFYGIVLFDKNTPLESTDPRYAISHINNKAIASRNESNSYTGEWIDTDGIFDYKLSQEQYYGYLTVYGSKLYRNNYFSIIDPYIKNLLTKFSFKEEDPNV